MPTKRQPWYSEKIAGVWYVTNGTHRHSWGGLAQWEAEAIAAKLNELSEYVRQAL